MKIAVDPEADWRNWMKIRAEDVLRMMTSEKLKLKLFEIWKLFWTMRILEMISEKIWESLLDNNRCLQSHQDHIHLEICIQYLSSSRFC